MSVLIVAATLTLAVLRIGNHLYWLAAVALLCLYLRGGRGSPPPPPPPGAAPPPDTYRAYRDRRDRQAKWERRYRRERPYETRRQQREKSR
ncbi:hypothetical protein ACFZC3_01995 [Streptomyces sp. NPDC007903]|uniref:hypothetical protein n=1 Tax=Streptomyces sp. NPDC007903 TaxID=3364786 RepID=UPI0036E76AD7